MRETLEKVIEAAKGVANAPVVGFSGASNEFITIPSNVVHELSLALGRYFSDNAKPRTAQQAVAEYLERNG